MMSSEPTCATKPELQAVGLAAMPFILVPKIPELHSCFGWKNDFCWCDTFTSAKLKFHLPACLPVTATARHNQLGAMMSLGQRRDESPGMRRKSKAPQLKAVWHGKPSD